MYLAGADELALDSTGMYVVRRTVAFSFPIQMQLFSSAGSALLPLEGLFALFSRTDALSMCLHKGNLGQLSPHAC